MAMPMPLKNCAYGQQNATARQHTSPATRQPAGLGFWLVAMRITGAAGQRGQNRKFRESLHGLGNHVWRVDGQRRPQIETRVLAPHRPRAYRISLSSAAQSMAAMRNIVPFPEPRAGPASEGVLGQCLGRRYPSQAPERQCSSQRPLLWGGALHAAFEVDSFVAAAGTS